VGSSLYGLPQHNLLTWNLETDMNARVAEMTKSILVADDSEQVRRYVSKLLRSNPDFEVCAEAVNGVDAVAKAKKFHPDLVILDLGMPLMNGLEAARELKNHRPETPIILFTLHGHMISDEQAARCGIDLVVAKSDINQLNEHVRSLLPLPEMDEIDSVS
jgi:DNA-binding NarL/FixJ family response regulator